MSTDEWQKRFEDKVKELEAVQSEFGEFQEDSRDLEGELERELTDLQNDKSETQELLEKQQLEIERLKSQSMSTDVVSAEAQKKIDRLMDELEDGKRTLGDIAVKHRKIEQINDDHERMRRVLEAKEQQLKDQLENAIENHVFVQDEFEDYKTQTASKMQKLHEDLRDAQADIELYKSPRKASDDPEFQAALQEREDLRMRLEEQSKTQQDLLAQRMKAEETAIEARRKAQVAEEDRLKAIREKDELFAQLQAEQEELRKQLIERNENQRIKRTRRMSEDARRLRTREKLKSGKRKSLTNIHAPFGLVHNNNKGTPTAWTMVTPTNASKTEKISPTSSEASSYSYLSSTGSLEDRDDELSLILEENELMKTHFEAEKEKQNLQATAKRRAQHEAEKATQEAERSEQATRLLLTEQTELLKQAIEEKNRLQAELKSQREEFESKQKQQKEKEQPKPHIGDFDHGKRRNSDSVRKENVKVKSHARNLSRTIEILKQEVAILRAKTAPIAKDMKWVEYVAKKPSGCTTLSVYVVGAEQLPTSAMNRLNTFCVLKSVDKHGDLLDMHRTDVSSLTTSSSSSSSSNSSSSGSSSGKHKPKRAVVWKQLFGHWKNVDQVDKLVIEVWNYHRYSWDDFLGTNVLLASQMDGETRQFKLLTKKFREPRKKDSISGYVTVEAKIG